MAGQLPQTARRGDRRSLYLGVALVLLGAVFLALHFTNVDLSVVAWPLWLVALGVVLLAIGLISRAYTVSLTVPGCMLIVAGLVILVENAAGLRLATWAYAWTLVLLGAVGAGVILQGLVLKRSWMVRAGLRTLVTGLVLFLLGAALFELVFGLNGSRFNPVARIVIPAALIALGLALVAGSLIPRRRPA